MAPARLAIGLAVGGSGGHVATMSADDIEWRVSKGLVPYPDALAEMEARATVVRAGEARELIWLLEHEPLFTAGIVTKTYPDGYDIDQLGPTEAAR